jgi:ubiquinone biosynthesis protein
VFEDNLFHGDLHPGNVVLLRRSRLALIDFGAVGSLEESFRKKYAQFHRSLSEREYAKAVEAVLLLSSALPHVDVEEVKRKLVRYFQAWEVRAKTKALPYHEKSISSVMNGMAEIMGEYKLPPSWEFLRLTRTFFAVDISLNELCEHVNVVRSIRRYWRAAGQRDWQLLQARIWSERNVHNVVTSQIELAEAVSETTMYATEVMRRRALSFAATASKFATLFEAGLRIVRWALVAVGIWLLAALLAQLAPAVLTRFGQQDLVRLAGRLPRLGWAGWVAVFVVFASLFKMTVRLVRKFAERETPLVQDVRT